jgi:hypothetical protein
MAKNSAPQSVQVNLRGVQRPPSRAEGSEDILLDCARPFPTRARGGRPVG